MAVGNKAIEIEIMGNIETGVSVSKYESTKVASSLTSIIIRDPYEILFAIFGEEYAEYRKRWKRAGERLYVTDFPIHIDIDITHSCNLSCQYCLENTEDRWSNIKMDRSSFIKILDEAEKEGACSINIGWDAEPLVYESLFIDLLEVINKHHIMDVFLHTNGVNFTNRVQEAVVKSKITTVCFSLGAVDDDTRKNKLKIIIDNIINFKNLRDRLKQSTPILRIGIVPTPDNFSKVPEYVGFWRNYADYIELQDINLVNQQIDQRFKQVVFNCNNPWTRLSIDAAGDIFPCCGFSCFNRNIRLGNIRDTSLKEAWNSEAAKILRASLLSGNLPHNNGCTRCLNTQYAVSDKASLVR